MNKTDQNPSLWNLSSNGWYSITERKRKEKEEEQGLVLIWGGWGKIEISFTLLLLCLIASIPGKDWKCVRRRRWVCSAQSEGVDERVEHFGKSMEKNVFFFLPSGHVWLFQ